MSKRPKPFAVINSRDATKAIYIDFEGFVNHSPSLLGVLIEDDFEQVVLDPILEPVARARGHRYSSLAEETYRLMSKCKDDGRFLVAYSQHERNVINEYVGVDISPIYKDARMIGKRWKNVCHYQDEIGGRGLKDFLEYIGYPRGSHLGEKQSTKRIRAVSEMIKRKGSYEDLTPVKKAQWTKLLSHNEIDCRGMKALVEIAARELS